MAREIHEPLEGKLLGWPVWVNIERNDGETTIFIECGPYTDENDNSCPVAVENALDRMRDDGIDFKTKRDALRFLKERGFVECETCSA